MTAHSMNPLWRGALFALALAGCPEPVVENPGDPDGIDEGASTRGVMGAEPGAMPAAGAPGPADQAPSGAVPDADLDPVHSQDDLADGLVISGTLGCEDCAGPLLVRVLPPPPGADDSDDEGIVLITQKVFAEPGPFEIRVPKDRTKVVLQVVEDSDESGKPSTGERMGLVIDGPVEVGTGVTGVELTVGVFPEMGAAPPQGGLPPGTEPPGGLPGGEAPAGGAPDGGAPEGGEGGQDGAITSGLPPATGAAGTAPAPALDTPAQAPGDPAPGGAGDPPPAGDQ